MAERPGYMGIGVGVGVMLAVEGGCVSTGNPGLASAAEVPSYYGVSVSARVLAPRELDEGYPYSPTELARRSGGIGTGSMPSRCRTSSRPYSPGGVGVRRPLPAVHTTNPLASPERQVRVQRNDLRRQAAHLRCLPTRSCTASAVLISRLSAALWWPRVPPRCPRGSGRGRPRSPRRPESSAPRL